ncbi:MAG: OmpA family protein [Pseudomonadota bacterium]
MKQDRKRVTVDRRRIASSVAAVLASLTAYGAALAQVGADAERHGVVDREALVSALRPITGETAGAVDLDIGFELDSAVLTPRAKRQLAELASAMRSDALASATYEINGHTDVTGPEAYNLRLSQRRAQAVRRHLIDREGIDAASLTAQGFGESRLKNVLSPASRENRRVEIVNRGLVDVDDDGSYVPITN